MAAPHTVVNISSSTEPSQKQVSASSHRLPTQSASAALEDLSSATSSSISCGLISLDRSLVWNPTTSKGGLERGKVVEVWGPSGSGKTALALDAAFEAIKAGGRAVWVDCSTLLSGSRLETVMSRLQGDDSSRTTDRFQYLSARTLSHLLALILHPPQSFPPSETALLVIDDVNSLVDLEYPRFPYNNSSRSDQQKWQAGRRYAVLGSFITALNKLAVIHNMAVIVTTGCSSRMRRDDGLPAAIGPGVGGSEWEGGIWSRIVAFRDFTGRFLGVQKCQGRNITPLDPIGDVRNAIGFEITAEGRLRGHVVDLTSSDPGQAPVQPAKPASSPIRIVRKRTYEEVADSEDEDEYGWAETDEVAAAKGLGDEHKAAKLDHKAT